MGGRQRPAGGALRAGDQLRHRLTRPAGGPDLGAARNGSARIRDRGAAVVEFVLVGALLTLLFGAVLQLAVVVHVRNTLVDCAGAGARVGALAGSDPAAGVERTRALVAADLAPAYATDVEAGVEVVDGLSTVVVRVRAPLPVAGLLGVGRGLVVEGHAQLEDPASAPVGTP